MQIERFCVVVWILISYARETIFCLVKINTTTCIYWFINSVQQSSQVPQMQQLLTNKLQPDLWLSEKLSSCGSSKLNSYSIIFRSYRQLTKQIQR